MRFFLGTYYVPPLGSCMSRPGKGNKNAIGIFFFGYILYTTLFVHLWVRDGVRNLIFFDFFLIFVFFCWVHIIYRTLCPSMGQRRCKKIDFLLFILRNMIYFYSFCIDILYTPSYILMYDLRVDEIISGFRIHLTLYLEYIYIYIYIHIYIYIYIYI